MLWDIMKSGHPRSAAYFTRNHLIAFFVMVGVTATLLNWMGRTWWCGCEELRPWSTKVRSMHNSQHFLDPYSLTHLLHGLAYYTLLLPLGRWMDTASRGTVAIAIESLWEIMENTSVVIEKYREATISLDYYGDSILNSLSDILFCGLGYALAVSLPWWGSVLGFLAVEGLLVSWIRDSLLLNILMLIWPIEALKTWQMSGG